MNPEFVPLQGSGYGGFPAQPGGPTVIQSTTVNIITDPPPDHIIWSLFCFCYYNPFCLGLAALIFSIKRLSPPNLKPPFPHLRLQILSMKITNRIGDNTLVEAKNAPGNYPTMYRGFRHSFRYTGTGWRVATVQSRDRKVAGDLEGARHYGSTARSLNIASSILAGIGLLCFLIVIITVSVVANQSYHSYNNNNYPYNRY
uniref:interferon-induced transmembrane protein 2-like n=1 Tax=Semicossyphus pulcher TaxID=241346 RepID=UPI0037E7364B